MIYLRNAFGKHHQKYSDALLDYGFFLLNVDSITHSVNVYKVNIWINNNTNQADKRYFYNLLLFIKKKKESLDIKKHILGNCNLHVAVAEEDLAYALYVREYSSGRFQNAEEHVEKSILILRDLVPTDHLILASARRVKALILEEIALDNLADSDTGTFNIITFMIFLFINSYNAKEDLMILYIYFRT